MFVCVDKSAADRLRLQKLIEESLDRCRDSIGHLPNLDSSPVSKDELLLRLSLPAPSKAQPSLIILGNSYSIEDLAAILKEVRECSSDIPILIFLKPESVNLRSLRRFEYYGAEVIQENDPPSRIVHHLIRASSQRKNIPRGKLFTFSGIKGGVGTTSLVTGLAHAAQAKGLSVVVHDLSKENILPQYLGTKRRHSPEFRVLLTDRAQPSKQLIERSTVVAPNGIPVFLPPSGGIEIRELWLRSSETLELTLGVFDILSQLYQIVFVDLGVTEGLLPFALNSRADQRVTVSSNEPASIHLLSEHLEGSNFFHGLRPAQIVVQMLMERSLKQSDVTNFLLHNCHSKDLQFAVHFVRKDLRASQWIGTGNSLYTEAAAPLQRELEQLFSTLNSDLSEQKSETLPYSSRLNALLKFISLNRKRSTLEIPLLSPPEERNVNFTLNKARLGSEAMVSGSRSNFRDDPLYLSPKMISGDFTKNNNSAATRFSS